MDQQEFEKQYLAFQKGRISRRQFMQATGLGTAAAVLAACAPPSPASSPAPATTAPASAAPASEAPATIDPSADWAPPQGVDLGKELYLTT